jgi:hypothetical protein
MVVIMVHDTLPYGHAPIPNIIDLSQKKQLFDLEVKCQGPNKGHYGTRHTSCGHAPNLVWVPDHKAMCRVA